jgi:ADP-ribose pyrophosphatase
MEYELIEKQVLYQGDRVRLEVHHLMAEGVRLRKEVVVHPGAVVIIPVLEDGKVLLIRNRRYALNQVLIELPAGTLEKGEDPINCAGRELLEETGYLARRLKAIAAFYTSPGILTEKMYTFLAYDLQKRQQELDLGEDIQLLPTPLDEAIEMIRSGQIQDGKTIAALMMYERFHR